MRSLAFVSVLAVAVLGCGEAAGPAPAPGASATASGVASASASASPERRLAPAPAFPSAQPVELPVGDPAVLGELAKVSACSRADVTVLALCDAHVAWSKFSDELVEGGNPARAKALVGGCLAATVHPDPSVRQTAYECVQIHAEHLADAKLVLAHAIGRLPGEPRKEVRRALLGAVDDLDPSKHGGVSELVAIARAIAAQRSTRDELEGIVDALRPEDDETEPSAEAFDLARDLLSRRVAIEESVDLLAHGKARAAEACDVFLALAEKGDRAWWAGVRGLARAEGRCEAQHARAVDVILRMAERAGPGVDDAWFGDPHDALERFFTNAKLSDAQKASLKKAAEAQKSQATRPRHRERLDALLAAL